MIHAKAEDLVMPTSYVDMSLNELEYNDGGASFSKILKVSAIVCAIAVGGGLLIGTGGLFASAATSGIAETAFSGVFYAGYGAAAIGATGLAVTGIAAGYSAIGNAITK